MRISERPLGLFAIVMATFNPMVQAASTPRRDGSGQEYGIGFDFTPSYGAVAVSFANGSNIALGRVDGDLNWHKLMSKIALEDRHMPEDMGAIETDGLVLLDMVQKLVAVGSSSLGWPVQAATVSLPAHTRSHHDYEFSTDDMIQYAFAVAGLEFVRIVRYTPCGEPLLFAENSILAGHGFALCENYTKDYNCGSLKDGRYDTYFLVGYYSNALEITRTAPVRTAYATRHYPYPNHTLGVDARHKYGSEEKYWKAVKHQLTSACSWRSDWHTTKVIIYGDYAGDLRLRREVTQVLKDFHQDPKTWTMVEDGMNSTYVGAFGAAEFVKRAPYANYPWANAAGLVTQPKRDL